MQLEQLALMSDGIDELCSAFELTRVDLARGVFLKREDTFMADGMCGAKVRLCLAVLELPTAKRGVVMAAGRTCSLPVIMSWLCKRRRVPVTVYYPKGKSSAQMSQVVANGAMTVEVYPGYPNVVEARAKNEAEACGMYYLPPKNTRRLGLGLTAFQTGNIDISSWRIVIPVGTGTTLAGVVLGMVKREWRGKVLGVVVGMTPNRHVEKCLGPEKHPLVEIEYVATGTGFKVRAKDTVLGGVDLDPFYAAKCIPFLEKGDLLWVTGRSVGLPARKRRVKIPEFETLGD